MNDYLFMHTNTEYHMSKCHEKFGSAQRPISAQTNSGMTTSVVYLKRSFYCMSFLLLFFTVVVPYMQFSHFRKLWNIGLRASARGLTAIPATDSQALWKNTPLIVLDIDGTLVSENAYSLARNDFIDPSLKDYANFTYENEKYNLIHFQLPGTIEFLQYLILQKLKPIAFFSSGIKERNEALVSALLEKAFPKQHKELLPTIPIFSRHHLRKDGSHLVKDLNLVAAHYKKKYHQVISLKDIMLIDDLREYQVKGQNFFRAALPCGSVGDPNRIFGLTGILDELFNSPGAVAEYLKKFEERFYDEEFTEKMNVNCSEIQDYTVKGLHLLKRFNSQLELITEKNLVL
jgi:hypothetical protein